jgi:ATP-dependent protease ClpP protease subunit
MQRLNTLIFKIFSAHIARPLEAIEAAAREDRTFTATDAQAFGIVDAVDLIPTTAASPRSG